MRLLQRRATARKAPEAAGVTEALRILARNRHYAEIEGVSPWQYAVLISTLEAAGLRSSDLEWLIEERYVEHALDCTRPGQQQRRFWKHAPKAFDRRTCFALTEEGARLADQMLVRGKPLTNVAGERPRWDAERRELWVGGTLVRRFLRGAPCQERILAALEERGWPERIPDPLPADPVVLRSDRLHDTIKNLNTSLKRSGLRFTRDGTGTGIRWEFVPPNVVRASAAASYHSRARKANNKSTVGANSRKSQSHQENAKNPGSPLAASKNGGQ